ncbi:MAG: gamma-glutamyltranspeptidase / glutathione hydrolase [Pseudonocardiales bacterium]|nr:gamma-glutamyltranspeptidase / glutathione hydrolase [Pseudonocardiales bacterium]
MSTTRPELTGSFGMIASTHWLASASGMSVLERGGNAFDAAVAAGFVLQVVEPHLNGPGGDLPAIVWSSADGAPHVVCGQGVAPRASSIDHFTALGLRLVPGTGLLAATVPGAFGAWTTMLERWGSWELADVLEPALHYAETGFPILPSIHRTIASVAGLFAEHWAPSARTWLVEGVPPRAGTVWRSPAIAATYRRILDEAVGHTREARIGAARSAWYSGFVAEEIGRFCELPWRDVSGRDHAGLLTADDLARWQVGVEAPVRVDYAGRYEVLKTGPWGQGPVLLQQLRLLESLGIQGETVRSARWIHLVTESAKLAFADREAWYGDDPDVPVEALLSRDYADLRARLVSETASSRLRPGSPDGRAPRLAVLPQPGAAAPGVGEPTVRRVPASDPDGPSPGDTCHVDVVDRWGNFVSATPSGGWLQSSPVIPELGFPLGTRAQMFFLEPGLPNSLRPGVRPRTTLSPSLALRDGEPWLAFGTPGGDQQDQWQLPFLLDVLHGGANLQEAIDAPTFHTNHFPSSFYPRVAVAGQVEIEDRMPPDVIGRLRDRGHDVVLSGPWSLGRLSAVAREGDVLKAAANARGAQGYAAGR